MNQQPHSPISRNKIFEFWLTFLLYYDEMLLIDQIIHSFLIIHFAVFYGCRYFPGIPWGQQGLNFILMRSSQLMRSHKNRQLVWNFSCSNQWLNFWWGDFSTKLDSRGRKRVVVVVVGVYEMEQRSPAGIKPNSQFTRGHAACVRQFLFFNMK